MSGAFLKIANISEEGRYGGPQARIVAIDDNLKRNGISTFVIFPDEDSNLFCEKLKESKISAARIKLRRLGRQKRRVIRYLLTFTIDVFALIRVIRKEKVDIVQCNGALQFKGVIAGRLTGKKVVWVLNSTTPRKVIDWIFFIFSRSCDGFIMTGYRVRNFHAENKRVRSKPRVVIHPPVDVEKLDPTKRWTSNEPILKKNNPAGFNIVTIANINPIKGLEYFIEMTHILNKNGRTDNFFIGGQKHRSQDGYFRYLKGLVDRYAIRNLEFTGRLHTAGIVLCDTDIFVCTSLYESGPMTVWEAMAMRKAIVSTDVGDVSRFIRNGENGFVVPTGDPKALAEKVAQLIADPGLRSEFGRKARDTAVQHLDVAICARKYAEFYRRIVRV